MSDLMNILSLKDIVPKVTAFTLSARPDQTLTLCRWSLRVRVWATEKYTPEQLKFIFEKQQIIEIADIAWFMLNEKDLFKDQDDFFDAVVTMQDQLNLIKALLGAVGIGEPEIKKINDAFEKDKEKAGASQSPNVKSPKSKKTGAKSLTP